MDQQIINPPSDSLFSENYRTAQNDINQEHDCEDGSRQGGSDDTQEDVRSSEEFGTAPTSPLKNDTQSTERPIITKQPLKHERNPYRNDSTDSGRSNKRKKVIYHPEKTKNKSVTCCYSASDMRPNRIDVCPKTWYRNCCTWQDLLEDAQFPKLLNISSPSTTNGVPPHLIDESTNEELNLSKRVIAERICWRACFVSICLPMCYPCYLSRTIRRSRRQGDVLRREEILHSNKSDNLLEISDNCMNRTLLSQLSEVKQNYRQESLEKSSKTNGHIQENMTEPTKLDEITEDVIEALEKKLTNNNDDKSARNSKVINVNVIVLKSNSSRSLHHHLSKKHDSYNNRY